MISEKWQASEDHEGKEDEACEITRVCPYSLPSVLALFLSVSLSYGMNKTGGDRVIRRKEEKKGERRWGVQGLERNREKKERRVIKRHSSSPERCVCV